MAYTYSAYVTTFRVTFLSVTHHIHTYIYAYICMYMRTLCLDSEPHANALGNKSQWNCDITSGQHATMHLFGLR